MSGVTPTSRPAPLACDDCRRKHLKCDGASPCKRCQNERQKCTYTASRRGLFRRKKGNSTSFGRSPSSPTIPDPVTQYRDRSSSSSVGLQEAAQFQIDAHRPAENAIQLPTYEQESIGHGMPYAGFTPSRSSSAARNAVTPGACFPGAFTPASFTPTHASNDGLVDSELAVDLFHAHFYQAHPFLVPRAYHNEQRYPLYLERLIRQIAQRFATTGISTAGGGRTEFAEILRENDERSIHRVQALLIAGIVLHADHDPGDAERCISRAMVIAKELGMNRPSFALSYATATASTTPKQVEESIRRTWWELYIIDTYLAALHRRRRKNEGRAEQPYLPCSQAQFEQPTISLDPPPSLQTFQDRVFMSDPERLQFSSYCYRIEAAHLIERILTLSTDGNATSDGVQAVDNALAGWKYNLPALRSNTITSSGEIDQMLFQAHCFIHCAAVLLHFPRSELPPTAPNPAQITGGREYRQHMPTSSQHTVKAIAASQELSNLAATPWPVERHSPLFACALILGCVVQLAAASIHVHQAGLDCLQQHRDRVVLMFGTLKAIGQRWAVAANALQKLKPIAHDIFKTTPSGAAAVDAATDDAGSSADSGFASNDVQSSVMWFDLFEPEPMDTAFLMSV